MYYYEIYVNYGHGGYSLAVKSETEKTDDEITKHLVDLKKFEEDEDVNNIEYIILTDSSVLEHFYNVILIP